MKLGLLLFVLLLGCTRNVVLDENSTDDLYHMEVRYNGEEPCDSSYQIEEISEAVEVGCIPFDFVFDVDPGGAIFCFNPDVSIYDVADLRLYNETTKVDSEVVIFSNCARIVADNNDLNHYGFTCTIVFSL